MTRGGTYLIPKPTMLDVRVGRGDGKVRPVDPGGIKHFGQQYGNHEPVSRYGERAFLNHRIRGLPGLADEDGLTRLRPALNGCAIESRRSHMTNEEQQLLTLAEAAPLLRKTEAAFRWYLRQPDCPLPTRKIGGRVMVRRADVEAISGVQANGTSTDTSYDNGYRDGYRAALADMRKALNNIDK